MALTPDAARRLARDVLEDTAADGPSPLGEAMSMPVQGTALRVGRYAVVGRLGAGGMGEVFRAVQEHPHREVALKLVRPELISAEARRRFEHEARVLARLQHPGIAQIFDAGEAETDGGPRPYFAMELVEGRPLTEHAAGAALGVRAKLELFLRVCDAVEHAHRKGVVHRDLKPSNILVTAAGEPKVLDFGVARMTDSDVRVTTLRTDIGKLIGTIPYMSPEQAAGEAAELDTRSDVYSLGVVLYELLAGRLPYELGKRPIPEAVRVVKEEEPAPLSSVSRVFRGDLETIAGKALEKERERRYQSVGELAGDVRRYLNDEAIVARPASAVYQIRKFARRNRMVVWSSAAVGLTLLGATIVATVLAVRERAAREHAEAKATEALTQEAIGTAVIYFFEDVLLASGESHTGHAVTLREAVEYAAEQLDARPMEVPGAEANIRRALGASLRKLGDIEGGIAQLRIALRIAEERDGPEAPGVAAICADLGGALRAAARSAEAEPYLRRALELESSAGENHEHRVAMMGELGNALLDQGRVSEAEEWYGRMMREAREKLGEDHKLVFSAMHNLAGLHLVRREFDAALAQAEACRAAQVSAGMDTDPGFRMLLKLIVHIQTARGDLGAAERMAEELVNASVAELGPSHLETLYCRYDLALIFAKAGRRE